MSDDAAPLVSVIIPVFDEAGTIAEVVRRVWELPFSKEVIVVDDGSADGTAAVVRRLEAELPGLRVHASPVNLGKGAAVRAGYALARGEVLAIQDADLELDPHDLTRLVARFEDPAVEAVYGTRFAGGQARCGLLHRAANRFLTGLTSALYGARLTDMETCYKLFRRRVIERIRLESSRFEFEPEVTAKVLRLGIPIVEVPVRYEARGAAEGKKIGWVDGVEAVATLVKWRLVPRRRWERGPR